MRANRIVAALLCLYAARGVAASPTYEDLVALIQTKQLRSLDALLAELPADYKQSYALLFDSDSLQYADPLNPRAVVFGEDASLALAFSCAAGDCVSRAGTALDQAYLDASRDPASFESLEILQFRAATRRFELFEIRFTAQGAQLSGPNPPQCLSCHGQDPRPNWEHYDVWPKAYGDNKDGGVTFPGRDADLATFKAGSAQRQRYRQLPAFAGNDSPIGGPGRDQPNSLLSERFQALNYRRIVREMQAAPGGPALRMATLGAAASCDLAAFFPADVNFDAYQSYAAELTAAAGSPKVEAYGTSKEFGFLSSYNRGMVAQMALYDLKGVVTREWPMSHPLGFYSSFVTPLNPTSLFLGAVYESAPEEMAAYLSLSPPRLPGLMEAELRSGVDCAKLAALSVAALANRPATDKPFFDRGAASWAALGAAQPAETLVQCKGCHTAAGAPYLPFDQPGRFTQQQLDRVAAQISATPGPAPARRMPPGGPYLDAAAQNVFTGYLNFRRRASQNPAGTP